MDFEELILMAEKKTGVDYKTGKNYEYYQLYTMVWGVKVLLYCGDKTGKALIAQALKEIEAGL